jgi:hypothetical protein
MSTVIIPQHRSHLNKNPQIPKRAKPNRIASPAIKSDFEKHATCLVPLMLERKGYASEILYVPECVACRKPILDFRSANISTVDETEEDLIPIGKLGDADASIIPSSGAFVFHKECDETGRSPWVGAHCVFKNDQRYAFEKRGAA